MIRALILLAVLLLFGCLMALNSEPIPAPACKDTSPDTCTAPACYPDIKPPKPQ